MLPTYQPNNCVELSAGEGGLLVPVLRRWASLEVTTCELDPQNIKILSDRFDGQHYNIDVLSPEFERVFEGRFSSFELAVSNPPFCWRQKTEYDVFVLSRFLLHDIFRSSRIRAEVLFLIQNIRLLSEGAYAAFILPELIICSALLSKFRERLLSICKVVSLAEVAGGEFRGTEARTFILIVQCGVVGKEFSFFSSKGVCSIRTAEEFILGLRSVCHVDLDNCDDSVSIQRGNFSSKECREAGFSYYHTSGFSGSGKTSQLDVTPLYRQPVLARRGDVLIGRVGSRVLGRAVIVKEGEYVISDCVFRLRFDTYDVAEQFLSYWEIYCLPSLLELARGTCAKYITKNDLRNYLSRFFLSAMC